ncbi:vezatin-like isoform X2 [Littorina saxatilis]|uniref:Vezatin n=1 Tax=Littorina saxatilis TaxID=31220 RepID=A0AAN9GC34_9CAEN
MISHAKKIQRTALRLRRACRSWWTDISKKFSYFVTPFTCEDSPTEMLRHVKERTFTELSGSSLLTEEDALFLQDMMADCLDHKRRKPTFFSRKMLALLLTAFACLVISILSPWLPFGPWISTTMNTVFVLLIPLLLVQIMVLLQSRTSHTSAEAFLGEIHVMLGVATKSLDAAAKCIRFIQESELVARGFTFVGNTATSRVLNELQMSSRQRQCPKLREKLFFTSKALFTTLRQSFSQVVKICPVSVEVSGMVRYCSEIPLSQYPDMLQVDTAEEESLSKLPGMTDGFSIDIVKSMQELNRIHVSEFIRRLAVCFVQENEEPNPFSSLAPVLQRMTEDLDRLQKDLQSHLAAHRHGSRSERNQNQNHAWQAPATASQLRQAYTAVHSLELHLLAALKKVQDMNQAMEHRMEENTKPDISETEGMDQTAREEEIAESCWESWNQILMLVKSEINASTGCLDEGVKQLQKKSLTESVIPRTQTQQPAPAKKSEENIVKMSADDNPIIMDEVFEAYSEPQEYQQHGRSEFASAEEEAWHKKQKGDLKMCLNELQSIIDVRAAETRERERAALDRMKSSSSAVTDHNFPSDEHRKSKEEEKAYSNSRANPDDKHGERYAGALHEDTEDLAKDIEDRVEFWKQFDQTERTVLATEQRDDRKDDEENGNDNISRSSSLEVVGAEMIAPHQRASVSSLQESDFVFIPTPASEKTDIAPVRSQLDEEVEGMGSQQCVPVPHQPPPPSHLHTSIARDSSDLPTVEDHFAVNHETCSEEKEDRSSSLAKKDSPFEEIDEKEDRSGSLAKKDSPFEEIDEKEDRSSSLAKKDSPFEEIDEKEDRSSSLAKKDSPFEEIDESQLEDKNNSRLEEKTCMQLHGRSDSQLKEKSREGVESGSRREPEGIEEHLSLPGAPSPFAFSIASMVASRAKNLARSEDTFGDSSSEEGEDEDCRDDEVVSG